MQASLLLVEHGRNMHIIVILLVVAAFLARADAEGNCPALLQAHKEKHPKEASPLRTSGEGGQQQMLYFLHVPRTAGRTFHSCFLKLGTHPHKRCPKVCASAPCTCSPDTWLRAFKRCSLMPREMFQLHCVANLT